MAEIAKITLKGESEAKNFIDEALRGDIAYEELSTTVSKTGGYVAGDHLIYLGQYYEVVADIAQGGTIVTSGAGQNVEEREVGDEIKKNKTQVDSQIQTLTSAFVNNVNENGCKNILPNYITPFSSGGANVAIDDDGIITVTASSALTGNCNIYPAGDSNIEENKKLYLPKGTYIGSGCPSGGSNSTYYVQFYNQSSSANLGYDYGEGVEFTLDSDTWIVVRASVRSGYTISGSVVFKPMITLATDVPSDYAHYVPFAKTNLQLTQDSVTWGDLSEVGAVNFLNHTATNLVQNGITFTVNADRSITANGTATAEEWVRIAQNVAVSESVRASGCPKGGTPSTYFMTFSQGGNSYREYGDGVIVPSGTIDNVYMVIKPNVTVDIVFKPMIAPVDYNGPYVPHAMTNKELTDYADYIDSLTGYSVSDFNYKPTKAPFINYVGNASEWANPIADAGTNGGTLLWLGRLDTAARLSQVFICNNGNIYTRLAKADDISGTWTYGPWHAITATS